MIRLNNYKKKLEKFVESKNRTLVLVNANYSENDITSLLRKFFIKKESNPTFVFLNFQLPPVCLEGLQNYILAQNCLTEDDCKKIDQYVFDHLSRNWYVNENSKIGNVTEFGGFDFGKLVEYDFQLFLLPRIKNLLITKKIIDSFKPEKIVVIDDNQELGLSAEMMSKLCDISIMKIDLKRSDYLGFLKSVPGEVARIVLDRVIRIILAFKNISKKKVGMDARIYSQDYERNNLKFMLIPFEKGLRIRLSILKKGLYLPFCFNSPFEIRSFTGEFADRWEKLKNNPDFRSIFNFQDIYIWDLVKDKLEEMFLKSFPRINRNVNVIKKFIANKRVSLFVMRNDVKELEKTIAIVCKEFKIPTLVLQHGIMSEDNGQEIIYADKMAVWGSAYVRKYSDFGNAPEKFVITGNPKFDSLYERKRIPDKKSLFKALNLDFSKKTIIFATQPISRFSAFYSNDNCKVLLSGILESMAQIGDIQLIIKIHPSENGKLQENILLNYSNKNVSIVKNFNIWDLLEICDLLITLNSTVALEAMILGKPVMVANFSGKVCPIPFVESGAAAGVKNPKEISPTMRKILREIYARDTLILSSKKFIKDHAYNIDGCSRKRVASLIEDLLIGCN